MEQDYFNILSLLSKHKQKNKNNNRYNYFLPNVLQDKYDFDRTLNEDIEVLKANNLYLDNLRLLENDMRAADSVFLSKGVQDINRKAILYSILNESGGDTTEHGNGAYGLIGVRGARRNNYLGKNAAEQASILYNQLYNTTNSDNWHYGKNSKFKTAKEAQQAFINAKTLEDATYALNFGFIRPKTSSSIYRTNKVNDYWRITPATIIKDK